MTDSLEEFDYGYSASSYYNNNSNHNTTGSSQSGGNSPNPFHSLPSPTFNPPSSSSNSYPVIHGNASIFRSRYASNSMDYNSERDYSVESTPITLGNTEVDQIDDQDSEEEAFQLINISIYDAMTPSSTILRVNRRIYAKEICRAIGNKLELSKEEAQYHTLVLVVTTFDHEKRMNVHCVRTFQNDELVLNIVDSLLAKLIEKYQVVDVTKLRNSVRWYYKDVRTTPIEFGDNEEATGEYSSDEEEEVSHSDLAYLAKAERKGYLLKRSSRDQNLWRKWYCVLTDHLWCIDIHRTVPKAICIRLSGMIRSSHLHNKNTSSYNNRRMSTGISRGTMLSVSEFSASMTSSGGLSGKDGLGSSNGYDGSTSSGSGQSMYSSEEQLLHNIVINSNRGTHLLRAFNLQDQKKWIEELHLKTTFALENDYFNMAEVIVCDEEVTKSRRFHRPIANLFNIPMFYDSLAQDQRRLTYTTVTIAVDEEDGNVGSSKSNFVDTDGLSYSSSSSSSSNTDSKSTTPRSPNPTFKGSGSNSPHPRSSNPSTPYQSSGNNSYGYSPAASPKPYGAFSLQSPNNSHTITTTKVHFSTIHPLDRTIQTSSLHRMYGYDTLFTHVLRLVLDILEYKELFRHDLFITSAYQRQVAVYIFLKYLLPILQIQYNQSLRGGSTASNDESNNSALVAGRVDGKLITYAIKNMAFTALKLNSFINDESELLSYVALAQSTPLTTPVKSKGRDQENIPPVLSPISNPQNATNVSSRSRLDMLWGLSNEKLMKVYTTLFVIGNNTGNNANNNGADRGSVRGSALGGSMMGDGNNSNKSLNGNQNNSSFWSWAWSSNNNSGSGSGTNSGNTSAKLNSLNNPQQSIGSDNNGEEGVIVNYPTQDLFDYILEDVQTILMNQS